MSNSKILQDNLKAYADATAKIKSFIDGIIDEASFVETDVFTAGKTFVDGAEALGEGVVTGYATIGGNPVQIIASNREILGGSFSAAHAAKMNKTIAKACATGTTLLSIIDSTGARIGEGTAVLEAYAATLFNSCSAKSTVPHIAIVKGAAVGMMAAYVANADYTFLSKDSIMSVNAPQALASDIKDYPKLNTILGADNYAAASNVANFTYKNDTELKTKLNDLLSIINGEEESADDANRETPALDKKYSADAALKAICDGGKYLEYNAGYAKEIKTVLAKINGIAVAVLATDSAVADGYITVEGVEKATDFVELADSNGFALITLVDAKGFKTCVKCEAQGFNKKLAKLCNAIAMFDNSKISVVAGKATGAIYSVLASKGIGFDYSLATIDAQIAPVNAETAVNVLYADELKKAKAPAEAREKLSAKYAEMEANPFVSAKDGFIDNIINASALRPYLASALLMLLGI